MKTFLEHIDFALYEGKHVPLERPMVEVTEDDNKEINNENGRRNQKKRRRK